MSLVDFIGTLDSRPDEKEHPFLKKLEVPKLKSINNSEEPGNRVLRNMYERLRTYIKKLARVRTRASIQVKY